MDNLGNGFADKFIELFRTKQPGPGRVTEDNFLILVNGNTIRRHLHQQAVTSLALA